MPSRSTVSGVSGEQVSSAHHHVIERSVTGIGDLVDVSHGGIGQHLGGAGDFIDHDRRVDHVHESIILVVDRSDAGQRSAGGGGRLAADCGEVERVDGDRARAGVGPGFSGLEQVIVIANGESRTRDRGHAQRIGHGHRGQRYVSRVGDDKCIGHQVAGARRWSGWQS